MWHGTDDLSRMARCKMAHRRKQKGLWETRNVSFLLLNIMRPPNLTSKFDASQLRARDEAYLAQCFECNASLWRTGSLQCTGRSHKVASWSSTNHNLLLPSLQLISRGNQTNLSETQQYSETFEWSSSMGNSRCNRNKRFIYMPRQPDDSIRKKLVEFMLMN